MGRCWCFLQVVARVLRLLRNHLQEAAETEETAVAVAPAVEGMLGRLAMMLGGSVSKN